MQDSSNGARDSWWSIKLAPAVSWREIGVFLVVVVVATCVSNFQQLMLPYILNAQLHVPVADQGKLSGGLATAQQLAILLFVGFAGAFADKIGRRRILLIAFTGYALCMFAFPLAGSVIVLFVIRFVFGIFQTGHTTGGATRMVADYPAEQSRGKFISLMLVVQAMAVALFVGVIGARIPSWLASSGYGAKEAGQIAYVVVGMVMLAAVIFGKFFLSKDRAIDRTEQTAPDAERKSFFANFAEVWRYAKVNPRFAFVMLIGMVIRTDSSIVGAFLALWVINAARTQGIDPATATATAGLLLSILSVASFATPPLFGLLADKVNRVVLLLIGVALTGIAFTSAALVDDVMGWGIVVTVCLIGLAEGAQTIAAQSLFGQEVPSHLRGSAMGVFATMGTGSVLLVTIVGGFMFDTVSYAAPFVLTGGLHFLCLFFAIILVIRKGKAMFAPAPISTSEASA
jgi:MFS family permease